MVVGVLSRSWFLLCFKLNLIFIVLIGSSHLNTKPLPLSMDQAPENCCCFYTCLSFLPCFCPFLCLIRMSFPPCTPSFPLIFCHSLFSLFLPSSGDAAKRKAWKLNRVASLRSIYANSLHNSEGNLKLKWRTCDGQVEPCQPPPLRHHPLQGWSTWSWRDGHLPRSFALVISNVKR